MSSCDLCGKESELFVVRVEGSIVHACSNCSKFGNVIEKIKEVEENEEKVKRNYKEETEEIIEDFSFALKKEREKRGLTQEELALRLNEKESVLHKLENGHLEPSLKLVRKLEKFFNINLFKKIEEKKIKLEKSERKIRTLGDLINRQQEQ